MKQDHSAFGPRGRSAKAAYASPALVEDRVRRFIPLVRKAAWHIHGSVPAGLEIEDLMQAGFIALTQCARRHDGPTEDGFAAYAKIRVRGAMLDLVRRQLPESRQTMRRRRERTEAEASLRLELGRAPSLAELAEKLRLSETELASQTGAEIQLTSLDGVYDDHSAQFADDAPDAFSLLAGQEDRERLAKAMAGLPERLQLVLQLYFVEELNLTEIAAVLEVSVPRVHQLKAQALARMRSVLAPED